MASKDKFLNWDDILSMQYGSICIHTSEISNINQFQSPVYKTKSHYSEVGVSETDLIAIGFAFTSII